MKTFVKGAPPSAEELARKQAAKEQAAAAPPPASSSTGTSGTSSYKASVPATPLEYEQLDLSAAYQDPLAVAAYGPAGSGKTRLLATQPGRVGVVPLNRKTLHTVQKTAKEFDKQIVLPKFNLVRSSNPMRTASLKPNCEKQVVVDIYRDQPMCCAIHNGRWAVDRTKQAALDMLKQCDSIGIDGFDLFTEDMLTAHYGRTERIMPKDRGTVNKEMIEFLGEMGSKHLVLTMAQKEVWRADKPTGEYDWAGWKHLDFHTNCIVHTKVNDKYDPKKAASMEGYWRWSVDVVLCQANPALMGVPGVDLLTDDSITFPMLAMQVFPESEYDDWL